MTTPAQNDGSELWTADELRSTALVYSELLEQQQAGSSADRAAAVALLRAGPLRARSEGSVHRRFANIGALLRRRGMPSLDGAVLENVGRHVAERLWETLREQPVILAALGEPTEDDSQLRARADDLLAAGPLPEPPGHETPGVMTATGQRYKRDPKVQAWVRRKAAGVCEACEQPAPFLDTSEQPFLEVHHVLPLGQGGSDRTTNAAALCPNCHRRCHLAVDALAYVDALYARVARLERETPSAVTPTEHQLSD